MSNLTDAAQRQANDADGHVKIGLAHYERAERRFDGGPVETGVDARAELLAAKAAFERALALKPNFPLAQRGVFLSLIGLNDIYQGCLAGLTYNKMQPHDASFVENFKDLQLRLMAEKALRPSANTPPPAISEAKPRDDWDVKAIADITRALPQPILGITAVFFHVDIGDKHPFLRGGDSDPQKSVDYLATLAAACRCARLTQPGISIILLTDENTALKDFAGADHVVRLPRNPMHLMYARARACRALVLSGRLQGPVLFVDTDVCLNRDFGPLFDGSFDVALCYRSSIRFPLMPINEGLMLGSPDRPGALAHFFQKYVDLYDWFAEQQQVNDRYGFDVRFWRGGQLALAGFAGWRVPPNTTDAVDVNAVRCRFLHCDSFNYAVQAGTQPPDLDHLWALHFKGLTPKAMMRQHLEHVEARHRPLL